MNDHINNVLDSVYKDLRTAMTDRELAKAVNIIKELELIVMKMSYDTPPKKEEKCEA